MALVAGVRCSFGGCYRLGASQRASGGTADISPNPPKAS